jgi:hypothetical protein
MKRLLIGGLSIVALSSVFANPVQADEINERQNRIDKFMESEILQSQGLDTEDDFRMMMMFDVRREEAFDLVRSAYRGEFEGEGIPPYHQLIMNYESGEIEARDVVEAAVADGELSPAALEDEDYIEAVEAQLEFLSIST